MRTVRNLRIREDTAAYLRNLEINSDLYDPKTRSMSTSQMEASARPRVAFVTGSTGFVGLNLVDELLSQGWIVHALHRPGSKRAALLRDLPSATEDGGAERLFFVEGDLGSPLSPKLPAECHVLFHLCLVQEPHSAVNKHRRGMTPAGFATEAGELHRRLNRDAMENVISAAEDHKVARVVFCSSWSAYGEHKGEITEDTPSNAAVKVATCLWEERSPVAYFLGKHECEEMLQNACRHGRIQGAAILQPGTILGRYGDSGWCQLFFRLRDTNGQMPSLPGASTFCDVQELARAFVSAADAGDGEACERYIIGGTNERTLTMMQCIAELVDVPAPTKATPLWVLRTLAYLNETLMHLPLLRYCRIMPSVVPAPQLLCKVAQDMSCKSDKAQAALGYRCLSLRSMLQRNFDWLTSSGALVASA